MSTFPWISNISHINFFPATITIAAAKKGKAKGTYHFLDKFVYICMGVCVCVRHCSDVSLHKFFSVIPLPHIHYLHFPSSISLWHALKRNQPGRQKVLFLVAVPDYAFPSKFYSNDVRCLYRSVIIQGIAFI